ncbi:amino acid/polyamine transporter I [Plectosphaerella plurivora]|uniref:Amino acid/polyamine transporter I n=1 Tax=Plectosphaerella plurivora TaxID=936078 RepID=A0A9P9AAJ8_9PEZI|nr:amino acid/polyamine transporter I [Plectosphaerella plurivora]
MDVERDQKHEAEPPLDVTESVQIGSSHRQMTHKPFTVWTAMGIGHSITNTAVTITVGMASGVAFGGPPVFFYGFLAMAVVAFFVAISLGELASALPHSGGQYYWVSVLAPERLRRPLSYITGVVAWAGAVCTAASVCLAVPIIIFNMIILSRPDFEYKPWMGFVGYQITNLLAFSFNLFERCLPWVSKTLLAYTLMAVTVVFVATLAGPGRQLSAEDFFAHLYNISGWPDGVAFFIGLNACNWAFSCLDAAVHLADEIPEPRKNIPKALLATVGLGSFTGLAIIFSLFFSVTDVEAVAGAATPSLQIFYDAFNGNTAAALGLQVLITISGAAAIIGIHTWQSRIAWAFSRDRGFPFHRFLSRIAPEPFGTPIWAHVWSCAWVSALGCLYLGSSLAFNSFVAGGILLQYLTYSTCIVCLLYHGRSNITPGPFWFPRLGLVANIVTVTWTLVALVFYSLPYFMPVQASQMNFVSAVVAGTYLYAVVYWVFFGRKEYKTPEAENYD